MISRILKAAALFLIFILVVGASAYLTLTLIVKSEDTVVVPDLMGKDVVYALELLSDLGLNTKVEGTEYSIKVSKNSVIYQEPEPGSEIKKGRDVRIIISKGPKSILMPNLENLPVQQARIIIDENSLCQGEISGTYSSHIKKDSIIAQFPTHGTTVTRGECVNLLVSMGIRPRTYEMPDLRGRFLDDAIPLIENNNLTIGKITYAFYEHHPLNSIVAQEPLSGYCIAKGRTVDLIVNRKPGKTGHGTASGSEESGVFRYRLKDGFLKRHIRVVLNSLGVSTPIFDDFLKPGEGIWLIIPRNDNTTVFLYEDDQLAETKVYENE